jgi:putative endonuclease
MKITLYVLRGLSTHKKYIGITNNLQRRLKEHQSGGAKGGQLIGEFELIHAEEFVDYPSARAREKFLKSGQGRQWLNENLNNPRPACGG